MLASIAGTLRDDYVKSAEADPWFDSPFKWIKTRPSRQVGKIGEQLVAGWCAAKGFDVTRSGDSEADRVIAGKRVEIKFSTLWKSGVFKFQQLRDQNYEYAICLGVSPFDARCWAISKETLLRHVIGVTPQHRGAAGSDTFWLSFRATTPPDWLDQCGGRLADVHGIISTCVVGGRLGVSHKHHGDRFLNGYHRTKPRREPTTAVWIPANQFRFSRKSDTTESAPVERQEWQIVQFQCDLRDLLP